MSLRRAGSIMLALVCVATALSAQGAAPSARAVLEMQTDPAAGRISNVGTMLVSKSGEVVLTQASEHLVRFVSPTGTMTTFGKAGTGSGEFQNNWNAGFVGDTLWVGDATPLLRLTYVAPNRSVIRTVPYPSNFTGPTGSQHQAPDLMQVIPSAIYGDGSVLLLPLFGAQADWSDLTVSGDRRTPFVFIDRNNKVRSIPGFSPEASCNQTVAVAGRNQTVRTPFCQVGVAVVAADGSRLVFLSEAAGAAAKPTFQVVAVSVKGDTLTKASVPFTPIPVPKPMADSALAAIRERLKTPDLQIDMPRRYPSFRRLIVGRDGTTWVERFTQDAEHDWLVLDSSGKQIMDLRFPASFQLRVGDSKNAWGTNVDQAGVTTVARYRLERGQ